MATTPAQRTSAAGPGLKRSLTVWAAVGLSLALMAPSMAANINPQGASGAGRAVPLAFLIVGGAWLAAAILAVLLAPRTARKLGAALAAREGITAAAPEGTVAADS
jgi:hypothetical protein